MVVDHSGHSCSPASAGRLPGSPQQGPAQAAPSRGQRNAARAGRPASSGRRRLQAVVQLVGEGPVLGSVCQHAGRQQPCARLPARLARRRRRGAWRRAVVGARARPARSVRERGVGKRVARAGGCRKASRHGAGAPPQARRHLEALLCTALCHQRSLGQPDRLDLVQQLPALNH